MPTWFGLGNLGLTPDELREIGFKSALMHAGAAMVIPLLALRVVVSSREIRANLGYIGLVIGVTMIAYVAVARVNVEFPSIAGGACGLIAAVWFAKHSVGLEVTPATNHDERIIWRSLLKATFPLWATLLILIMTRVEVFPGRQSWRF